MSITTGTIIEEELRIEEEAVAEGVRRYYEQVQSAVARGDGASVKPAERLMLHWFAPVRREMVKEITAIRQNKPCKHRTTYGPVIHLVDPSILAIIGIRETLSHCMAGDGEAKVAKVAYAIGNAVIAHLHGEQLRRDPSHKEAFAKLVARIRKMNPCKLNHFVRENLDEHYWSIRIATKVGVRILWAVIEACVAGNYDDPKPAAAFLYRARVKRSSVVAMTRKAWDLIKDGHAARQFLRPCFMPMVCTPMEWQFDPKDGTLVEGGYLRIRTPLMCHPTKRQRAALLETKPQGVLDGVNILGSTRFRVNKRVAQVQRALWDRGGAAAGIPRADNIPFPPAPADYKKNEEARLAWNREASEIHGKNRALIGKRTEFINTLDLADRYSEYDSFCLPHQIDARMRSYAIPVYLNHYGGDLSRSLFQFASRVPATSSDAERWLQIQAANCAGLDKKTFDERIAWVHANRQEIERVVSDPLKHDSWMRAKKPFQFLAACYALCDSEEAAHLPIQLDGTCNGLQQLAAMGRDELCAQVVNLVPTLTPGDAYGTIAEKTRPILEADAARGVIDASVFLAALSRDLCKVTVMTKLYNVSDYGASQAMLPAVRELGFQGKQLYDAARYFSKLVLAGTARAYPRAMAVMEWMCESAGRIVTKYPTRPLQWTNPMGMTVMQNGPKHMRYKKIRVLASDLYLTFPSEVENMRVRKGKQCDGAPPNINHSVDASHKFMWAIECHKRGIEPADNHDNFWSHAARATESGQINREQFVRIHSRDVLAGIREEWRTLYPEADIPELPEYGTLNIASVLDSPYFFH